MFCSYLPLFQVIYLLLASIRFLFLGSFVCLFVPYLVDVNLSGSFQFIVFISINRIQILPSLARGAPECLWPGPSDV